MPVVMLYRISHYRTIKYQYFLIDFCYFANVCVFIFLLILPTNVAMFRIIFTFANGRDEEQISYSQTTNTHGEKSTCARATVTVNYKLLQVNTNTSFCLLM